MILIIITIISYSLFLNYNHLNKDNKVLRKTIDDLNIFSTFLFKNYFLVNK